MAAAPKPGRLARTRAAAKRGWPIALEAWRRWDNLSPAQKERYRKMAGDYAQRGRKALATRRGRKR
jgi:hypothetical protein